MFKTTSSITAHRLLMLFLFFSTLILQAQEGKVDGILEDFYGNRDVLVASHRAAHQKYPENSIAAIKECIRLGVDIVELDVRQTRDGVLLIMHDKTIDRTTNGSGDVKKLNWSVLQKVQLLQNGEISSEKIPTFEEVLKVAKGNIIIDIDFKANSTEAVNKTYELIQKYEMENQVLFYLYDYTKIGELRQINSKVKIMPRAYSKKDVKNIFKHDSIFVTHVDHKFYNPNLMAGIIKKGSRVWINALGKYDSMETELKNSGFDELFKKKHINIIQTDLPEELLTYLREKKLHK